MKMQLAVIALLMFVAGIATGLLGRNFISPANAAENEIIYVSGVDQEVGNKCNFNKTIVRGNIYTICVRK
jgi:hypothetical protein